MVMLAMLLDGPQVQASEPVEEIVLACGSPCSEEPPRTAFSDPWCDDYDLHTSLIEAVERRDASAIPLLRERYDRQLSIIERHRIASALLGKVADDSALWADLYEHAAVAVRFPLVDGGYADAFRGVATEDVWNVTVNAFEHASRDPRSRALLREVLEKRDPSLIVLAIAGLAMQRDMEALPAIDETIAAMDADPTMVVALALFAMPEVDAIAFKYLEGCERDSYLELRGSQ
jgi:hypothetical protein